MDGRHEDVSFIAKVRITKKGGMTNDHNPYTVPSFGTFGTCLVWAHTVVLTGFTETRTTKDGGYHQENYKGFIIICPGCVCVNHSEEWNSTTGLSPQVNRQGSGIGGPHIIIQVSLRPARCSVRSTDPLWGGLLGESSCGLLAAGNGSDKKS